MRARRRGPSCASRRALLDPEGKRNVDESHYGFVIVEHHRLEYQVGYGVAHGAREVLVTEGFDDGGSRHHATGGVDVEPSSDESVRGLLRLTRRILLTW